MCTGTSVITNFIFIYENVKWQPLPSVQYSRSILNSDGALNAPVLNPFQNHSNFVNYYHGWARYTFANTKFKHSHLDHFPNIKINVCKSRPTTVLHIFPSPPLCLSLHGSFSICCYANWSGDFSLLATDWTDWLSASILNCWRNPYDIVQKVRFLSPFDIEYSFSLFVVVVIYRLNCFLALSEKIDSKKL